VAPASLGIQGRVVARNRPGGQVLVAPTGGRLTIPPAQRAAALRC
jgi:L-serine deaminase